MVYLKPLDLLILIGALPQLVPGEVVVLDFERIAKEVGVSVSSVSSAFCFQTFRNMVRQDFVYGADGEGTVVYLFRPELVAPDLDDKSTILFPGLRTGCYDLLDQEAMSELKKVLQDGFAPSNVAQRTKVFTTLLSARGVVPPEGEVLTQEQMVKAGFAFPEKPGVSANMSKQKVRKAKSRSTAPPVTPKPHKPKKIVLPRKKRFSEAIELTPQRIGYILGFYRFCREKGQKEAKPSKVIGFLNLTAKEAVVFRRSARQFTDLGLFSKTKSGYCVASSAQEVVLKPWGDQQELPDGLEFDRSYSLAEIFTALGLDKIEPAEEKVEDEKQPVQESMIPALIPSRYARLLLVRKRYVELRRSIWPNDLFVDGYLRNVAKNYVYNDFTFFVNNGFLVKKELGYVPGPQRELSIRPWKEEIAPEGIEFGQPITLGEIEEVEETPPPPGVFPELSIERVRRLYLMICLCEQNGGSASPLELNAPGCWNNRPFHSVNTDLGRMLRDGFIKRVKLGRYAPCFEGRFRFVKYRSEHLELPHNWDFGTIHSVSEIKSFLEESFPREIPEPNLTSPESLLSDVIARIHQTCESAKEEIDKMAQSAIDNLSLLKDRLSK